jgi:CDP-diacylglycerol--serine O-phosphatidyltransferase
VVGITFLLNDQLTFAALMIIAGSLFDFLDGFAARALNAKSELGKQLDSLADLVTFGVLPSLIVFNIITSFTQEWYAYISLGIALAAGFRLAKFNIDQRQTNYFIGLPTPANALLVCSLPFLIKEEHLQNQITPVSLVILSVILAILMVAPLPLLSFKFSHYKWKGNKYRYILILLFLV